MTDFKGNGKQEMNKNAKFNKKFHKPPNQTQQNSTPQQEATAIVPCLMFSNLPADGAKSKVMQMCSSYGQVTAVRYNPNLQRCFVDFARTIDMENALIGLEQNVHNIKVSKGQNKIKVSNNQNQDQTNIPHHNPFRNPPQGANSKELAQKSSNDENNLQGAQKEATNKQEKSVENQMQQKSSYKQQQQQQQMKPQFNQQKQPFHQQQQQQNGNHMKMKPPLQQQQQQQMKPQFNQQKQPFNQQPKQQQQQYGNHMQMKPPLQQQQQQHQNFNNQQNQPQQQQQYRNHMQMKPPLQQQQQQHQNFNNQQHQRSPQQQQQQYGNNMQMKPPLQQQQQQHQPFNNQQHQRSPQQQQQYGNQMQQTKNSFNQQQQQQKFGNKMQGQNSGAVNQKQKYQKPNAAQAEIIRNKRAQTEMAQPKEAVKYLQEHQINITPGTSIKTPVNLTLPASKNLNEMTNLIKKCQLAKCVVCERSCSLTCAACGTFICSQECQIQSWQRHRLLCKKISYESANGQRLVEVKDTNLPYPELPSNGSTVRIMSISKANVVFVRPTSILEDAAFFDLLSKINFEGATLPALLQPPKVGQIVVCQLENSFHRAQVLDATNQLKIRIIFLDFGELAEKPLFHLFEAPEDYMFIPRIVMPVLLKGVAEIYTSLNMRMYLKAFVENLRFKLSYSAEDFLKEKNAYQVDLIDVATQKSFNDLIRRLCMPQDKEFKLKNLPLKTGKNVELLVMDNSRLTKGYLYCCLRSLVLDIKEIQDSIATYMETSKQIVGEKPAVGKYCLVKNNDDGDWYRGKVLNLLDTNLYDVLLLDFGKQKNVAASDICSYPEKLDGPIGTRLCQIKGFPQVCEESFVTRLKALIREGMTIKCAEVEQQTDEKGDEFYMLNIDELLNAANETVLNIINM